MSQYDNQKLLMRGLMMRWARAKSDEKRNALVSFWRVVFQRSLQCA